MKDFIEFLVKNIVGQPDEIVIEEMVLETDDGRKSISYIISVAQEDMALLIGKGGQTIRSVRNIAKIKAIKDGVYVDISIKE